MTTNDDDFAELEGPYEQTPGTTAGSESSGSSESVPQVKIIPDDGVAGVVGDMVPGVNGSKGERHFVSPKKTIQIPDLYVNLKAVGVTEEVFKSTYEWESGPGGENVKDEPLKYRVKRNRTRKVQVKIKLKATGQVVDKLNVWVIWASGVPKRVSTPVFTQFPATPASQNPPRPAIPAGSEYAESTRKYTWSFVFKIEPAEIITAQERPLLSGPQDKTHDVPGAAYPFASNPKQKADEAQLKWDASRQMKWTITDSTGTTTPVVFPTDDAEGNDDAEGHGADEHDDPYHGYTEIPSLAHAAGEIISVDSPIFGRNNIDGKTDGEIYRKQVDFREFTRVQLWDGKRSQGRFWFRISDYINWHHYFRAKFKTRTFGDPTWEDDGSNDGQP